MDSTLDVLQRTGEVEALLGELQLAILRLLMCLLRPPPIQTVKYRRALVSKIDADL